MLNCVHLYKTHQIQPHRNDIDVTVINVIRDKLRNYVNCNATLDRELVQPGCKIPPRSNRQFYQWWVAFYVLSGQCNKDLRCVHDCCYYIIFMTMTKRMNPQCHTQTQHVNFMCKRGTMVDTTLDPERLKSDK